MFKVLVIMPTFNGKRYIEAQINSILQQKGIDVDILIRDDCSSDNTYEILIKYKDQYPDKIHLYSGKNNLGPNGSIFELIHKIPKKDYDFYSFADQDDWWLEDKLISAISRLNEMNKDKPCLYLSNLTVTDENLNVRFLAYPIKQISCKKMNVFTDFSSSGNTFVFNKLALQIYQNGEFISEFHGDVWFYLRCVFLGDVFYDKDSYILFRRNGENASGERYSGFRAWLERLIKLPKIITSKNDMRRDMAIMLLSKYQRNLNENDKQILSLVANYKNSIVSKLQLIFSKKVKASTFGRQVIFITRVIFGRL